MINLLPPPYKKKLQEEQHVRLAIILGLLVLLFFVCLSLLFLAIRIYVSGELQAQEILIDTRKQEVQEEQSPVIRTRELNQNITKLAAFYGQRVVLSTILQDITRASPSDANLTSFQYNATLGPGQQQNTQGKVFVTGFAPTTEGLLALRANLEEHPSFENFFFPPSNWVDSADIEFSFTFEVHSP